MSAQTCDGPLSEPTPYRNGDLYGSYWCKAGSSTCYALVIKSDGELTANLCGTPGYFQAYFRGWTAITKAELPAAVKLAAYREIAHE
jgi:hypothetical protein